VFAYGFLALYLLETSQPLWYPQLGSYAVGTALEIPLAALQALVEPPSGSFESLRLALQVVRSLLLCCLCVSAAWYALDDKFFSAKNQVETEPLLSNQANGSTAKANYGATPKGDGDDDDDDFDDGGSTDIDSDGDEPAQIKELKEQQRKRLQESGSWLNYFKQYRIFIPMVIPQKNRFVQGCMAIVGVVLIAQRFLNVLVPRQLGIMTQELSDSYGTGIFPWRSVVIWMVLSWLGSQAGIHIIENVAEFPVQQYAYKQIGAKAFEHIMTLSMDFHNEKQSGELIRAIDQGQNLTSMMQFMCTEIWPTFIDLIVAFVYVYLLFDIYMSCILILVGVAYMYVGAKTTAWNVKRRRRFNTALRNESKIQNEAINNWQTVSHFNRGEFECDRYSKAIDEFNASELAYYMAYFFGGGAQSLIMILGRLAATFLAAYRVSQGSATLGDFVTLTTYWRNVEGPVIRVSWSIRRVTSMLTDSERLLQLFQTTATIVDAPNAVELSIKDGEVEFDGVDFAYNARRATLSDVSFKAKSGQTVALVGETGGGKSTIMKLLYRYYDVQGGAIRIDGQDIRGVTLDSLRDSFGMVPQDPSLFNISIMENVRYARLDATDEEVKDACRAAAIHDKIETFPDKYESTVGERGVKLSGGELQRIAIARAILRQPKIVLLDEATSMIDAETEALIQEALKRLRQSRTTFIIAHRLSTIQHADLILVVHDGKVVERGTHDELFRMKGKYVALWSKQLSKDVKDIGSTLHVDSKDEALIDLDPEAGSEARLLDEADDADDESS
jgi:ABC-type transport system involved in Fe-S cluster assembly fused permease/ATPase subunit